MKAADVVKQLKSKAIPEKAAFFPRFFKTGPGEYGEGDKFIGVVVPEQRKIARKFVDLNEAEVIKLLDSPMHECRLTGLLIMVGQFERSKDRSEHKRIYDLYFRKMDRVNGWDLVDSSAHKIVGPYLNDCSRAPLAKLARRRNHLWANRIAIVATYHYIKQDDLESTLEISTILINHPHDLIHKAVGWMLREMGKRNETVLIEFLKEHLEEMPRTALRYAIEKFPKSRRQKILKGQI